MDTTIKPAKYDFTMRRGNYGKIGAITVAMRTSAGTPLDFSQCIVTLTVMGRAQLFRKSTADGTLKVDPAAGTISWEPTLQETRMVPNGASTTYYVDIAYSDGSGQRALEGTLISVGT